MHIKPKDIKVDLPSIYMFEEIDEIAKFASNINTIIHGKVKIKCENLGKLGEKYVGIFYLQRNQEFQELREEFIKLINKDSINNIDSDGKDRDSLY